MCIYMLRSWWMKGYGAIFHKGGPDGVLHLGVAIEGHGLSLYWILEDHAVDGLTDWQHAMMDE